MEKYKYEIYFFLYYFLHVILSLRLKYSKKSQFNYLF